MFKIIKIILFSILIFFSKNCFALSSNWDGIQEAKVRLISGLFENKKEEITIGLEYKLMKGWKTYWKSPGAGGFPQEINHSNSSNIEKIEVLWPTPKQFSILDIKSLGYENEVVFPIKISLNNKNQPTLVNFNINFLVCKEICLPGSANLSLLIPSGDEIKITKHSYIIEKYISQSPLENEKNFNINFNESVFYIDNQKALLEIQIQKNIPFKNPKLYIDNNIGLPVVDAILEFNETKNILYASFYYPSNLINLDQSILNLHLSDYPFVYEKRILPKISGNENNIFNKFKFSNIIIIALLGGLILNIMPCVLPILSIKLLSVLSYSGQNKSLIRRGFIFTSCGIIFSYILLAFILVGIRYSGQGIGWGMQFQQPFYLMLMSIILLFFSLNLMGFYEISFSNSINTFILNSKFNKKNFSDFFFGFFATLMATPCSAPFVGTAVTFAFTQNSILLILTFLFMGIGMSSPYIIVALFPSLINFLPKSGKWTILIQRFMGCLLILTMFWLGTILMKHYGNNFIYIFLLFFISIVLIFLLKTKKYISNKSLFTFSVFFIILYLIFPDLAKLKQSIEIKNENWISLNDTNLDSLLENNKIVFVDITADWCVTCKYNKQTVINIKEIQDLFKKNDVIQVQGDWTLPDEKIKNFLNTYNKFGIPFNIMYSHKRPNGIIMPELITKKDIKETLQKIK